jgi:hypothetical protein
LDYGTGVDSVFVIATLMIDERHGHSLQRRDKNRTTKYDGEGLAAFPVVVEGSRPAGAELANLTFTVPL